MKRQLSTLAILGSLAFLAGTSYAAPCDPGVNCNIPASNGSQASWSPTATGMSAVQAQNSGTGVGNVAGSRYYFAASSTDQGATLPNGALSTTGSGSEVIGSFAINSSGLPASAVTGGLVQNLLGNQSYTFYAQACPTGAALDSANCSQWARIGTRTTSPYPTAVFSAPVAPGDATINTIRARTSVPTTDVGFVSQINLTINDLTNGINQTLTPIGWPGTNQANTIDSTMFTAGGGFRPNTKYQYQGQITYPYAVNVPTAGPETEGPFWTTPANPFNVVTANVTHCSVQITARNSSGSPANPTYTPYRLCATGVCATPVAIGGTGIPTDTVSTTVTGLTAGTSYTPNARANVGNGSDATANSWNNSGVVNGTSFTTLSWAGAFNIGSITTNSAAFNITSLNTAGISSYQMRLNGTLIGSPTAGAPAVPGSIPLNSLTPNTAYTAQIRLTETSGCFSDLPAPALSFTTTPNVPLTFDVNATSPFQLSASWTANGNPGATTYQVQYCTDAGFTQNCQTVTTAAGATSATLTTGVNPTTTYFAHVRAMTVGGGLNSAYSNTDSATTPADVSNITIAPTSASLATGNNQVFTATVKDANGVTIPGQAVNWVVSGGGNLSTANGASTTFTATTPGGPFTLTASLATYPNATASITVVASGIVITQQPTLTLNPDNITGTLATNATDNVLGAASINYTWSVLSGPGSATFTPNGTNASRNSTITFTRAGTYVIRVTYSNANGSTTADTSATVVPQVLSGIIVSPTNITLKTLQNQVFTATGADQFAQSMSIGAVTWSTTGNANISGNGAQVNFNSAQLGQQLRVTATSGSFSGSASVSIISFDVSGAFAFPVPYKSNQSTQITFRNIGNDAKIRIYTASGREVFNVAVQPSNGEYSWNVRNMSGEKLASGVYFYVIESPDGKKDGKLIIIQ